MVIWPRLFIDTINLTISVPENEQRQVEDWLHHASSYPSNITQRDAKNSRYRRVYQMSAANCEMVRIEIAPRNATNAFMRLDYSPERIEHAGAVMLAQTLASCLGPNFREYFLAGKATRLDVTFDVRRVPLRDLWIIDHRSRAFQSALIRGEGLEIETVYCGYSTKRKRCHRQFIAYDKLMERRAANDPSTSSSPWVRFEYRYQKGDYTLENLYRSLANPYDEFSIKRYTPIPEYMDDVQSRLLFDACRLRGKANVLATVPNTDRQRVRLAIEAFRTAHFFRRPIAIWMQLRDRINELLP